MNDFWIACGHHLLDRDEGGGLRVTDDFLKAYFARPELMPPDDACPVERRLHRELLADPRQPVGADEIAGIADPKVALRVLNHWVCSSQGNARTLAITLDPSIDNLT